MNFSSSIGRTFTGRDRSIVQSALDHLAVIRTPRRKLSWRRFLFGGRVSDLGRLPRYLAFFLLGSTLIWAPILGYLSSAPLIFSSHMSLILPGSGASATVNLNEIGQASSYASSAFASNSVSPTETYKRLIGADRILAATAKNLNIQRDDLGRPRVTLVDQTGLIHIELTAGSSETAQERGDALLEAFLSEIEALRSDELATREKGSTGAIADYVESVDRTRAAITLLQMESGLMNAEQFKELCASNDQLAIDVKDLRAKLEKQFAKVRSLEETLGVSARIGAATLRLFADAEYLALLENVSVFRAKLADARARFGSSHPKVLSAHSAHEGAEMDANARAVEVTRLPLSELDDLDRASEGERAELLSNLVWEDVLHKGLVAEFEIQSVRLQEEGNRLRNLSPIAAELEDKQRDFAIAEAVFASAIARAQSTKSDVYASYPLVQVLENPSLPKEPSSPKRKLAYLAAVASTLMLLIGLALGWVRLPLVNWLTGRGEV